MKEKRARANGDKVEREQLRVEDGRAGKTVRLNFKSGKKLLIT